MKKSDFKSISSVLEGHANVGSRLHESRAFDSAALDRFIDFLVEEGFELEDLQKLLHTDEGLDYLFNTDEGSALLEAGGLLGFAGNVVRGVGSAVGGVARAAAAHPTTAAYMLGFPGVAAGLLAAKGVGLAARTLPAALDYKRNKIADKQRTELHAMRMQAMQDKAARRAAKAAKKTGSGGGGSKGGGSGGGPIP